jgi:hypothetical protein
MMIILIDMNKYISLKDEHEKKRIVIKHIGNEDSIYMINDVTCEYKSTFFRFLSYFYK